MKRGKTIVKLKNRRGASMTLALMLLLVASMSTAVILAASVNAVKSVRNFRDTKQKMYTLQSALIAVRNEITGKTVVIEGEKLTVEPENPGDPLSAYLRKAVPAAKNQMNQAEDLSGSFTVKTKTAAEMQNLFPAVGVSLMMEPCADNYMDNGYDITLRCTLDDAESVEVVLTATQQTQEGSIKLSWMPKEQES